MRLIDADALYEKLRYIPYDNILEGTIGHEKPLIAIVNAPTVEMPDWISVQDKLPDGKCIAYSMKWFEMIIGYVYKTMASDTGYEAENENEVLRDISHWRPLPEPPKEVMRDV